jgi:hypothetical protein
VGSPISRISQRWNSIRRGFCASPIYATWFCAFKVNDFHTPRLVVRIHGSEREEIGRTLVVGREDSTECGCAGCDLASNGVRHSEGSEAGRDKSLKEHCKWIVERRG